MSEAVERLAAALRLPGITSGESLLGMGDEAKQWAELALIADPALAEAIELGLAWQAAEAALPEGWNFTSLTYAPKPRQWMAAALGPVVWTGKRPDGTERRNGLGTTPAEALRALTAKLAEVKP